MQIANVTISILRSESFNSVFSIALKVFICCSLPVSVPKICVLKITAGTVCNHLLNGSIEYSFSLL